jgi:hypothetical protein
MNIKYDRKLTNQHHINYSTHPDNKAQKYYTINISKGNNSRKLSDQTGMRINQVKGHSIMDIF